MAKIACHDSYKPHQLLTFQGYYGKDSLLSLLNTAEMKLVTQIDKFKTESCYFEPN